MDTQQPLVAALAAEDPEIVDRLVTRREAIARGAATTSAVAAGLRMASVPVALAALSRDAFGQALPAVVNAVLNYALVLEELEYEFYQRGTDAAGLIRASDRAIFERIREHEFDHREFLRRTLGAAARPKPAFDFTGGRGQGGGLYPNVFSDYNVFLAVAQAFEDTGVRAYKGQAAALRPYPAVLTTALEIHSVEARHASEVRRLRGDFMDMEPNGQGWPNLNSTDVSGAAAVYAGEENVVQGGVDLTTLTFNPPIARDEIAEAFDEPLTQAQVLAIVDPFLARSAPAT